MSEATFERVLGERVKTRREELGYTQDEVAHVVRDLTGLDWTRPVIASIERGTRQLTVPELASLLSVLEVSLPDLLKGAGEVVLTPWTRADAESLLLEGEIRAEPPWIKKMAKAFQERMAQKARFWPKAKPADVVKAERAMRSDAERRAALELGVDPFEVSLLAYRLWGRSLSEERDARVRDVAPPDASPASIKAFRGRITRQLKEAIRSELERSKGRSS